ncbi:WAT1-related protein At3g28050-like [Mercurialis annua]|uniref:WAT1-related protein At3g28050-like n=1 Tax=Mercurialis annua TaxID=3986 RepID=UPI00216090C6|nr:WAT1-related protein At3g28050-like [Mercurialis annua]
MWDSGTAVTVAMVTTAFTEVAISTMMKAAMERGMSQFVYIAYSNALALFFLFPSSYFFYRKRPRPRLTLRIFSKILLMGTLSCCVQTFMNTGIKLSSPTMSAAMTDLTPAFTFVLAVISRMERLECRLQSSQAKSIGTTISVVGALIVTFYKGLPLTSLPAHSSTLNDLPATPNWAAGGIFCAAGAWCLSSLYVVQTWILKEFPSELMMTSISISFVTLFSSIIGVIAVNDVNAWILKPDIELLAIICSAIFAVAIRNVVHTWACHIKGPLYTAMFNPLGMIIATLLGVSFLGDTLYIGCIIGGTIIAVGFYTVLWGKSQEDKMIEIEDENYSIYDQSPSSPKVPLLQNKKLDV